MPSGPAGSSRASSVPRPRLPPGARHCPVRVGAEIVVRDIASLNLRHRVVDGGLHICHVDPALGLETGRGGPSAVITALRTAVSVIACQVSAAVGDKLLGFAGFASAPAAGRSAAARTPSATATSARFLARASARVRAASAPRVASPANQASRLRRIFPLGRMTVSRSPTGTSPTSIQSAAGTTEATSGR
jgi:hypothetical protein